MNQPFEQLLSALHPDRERAGAQYRELHLQLVAFFDWRCSRRADEQADEVIDRVIRRIAEGERIVNLRTYALGVARLILQEEHKHAAREQVFHSQLLTLGKDFEEPEAADDEKRTRFERCLDALSQNNRAIILAYYTGDGRTKIETRRRLAAEMGMDLNALRVRAHRIRARLEQCIFHCPLPKCNVSARIATS